MIKTLWLIYGILRWHKRTFPNATAEQQEQKLAEEIRDIKEDQKFAVEVLSERNVLQQFIKYVEVIYEN